ncbi:MAG: histidine kinase, partial [Gammaproteobacteria bacterium]|nr:histidine kinase [Gammaproteobacteria bacterium]
LENAIYHGIEPMTNGGTIGVEAKQKNNKLELSVSNPLGNGAMIKHNGNHMAQQNIQQRINLAYGENASFTIMETETSYSVILVIPLETPSI